MTRHDSDHTSEPIRIGVLYSRSGVTAAVERTQLLRRPQEIHASMQQPETQHRH